jgi:arginine/lysine/ornithine decarboxylase
MPITDFETTPLLRALAGKAGDDWLGFHMPGHQRGKGLWKPFSAFLRDKGPAVDLTELPELDNLRMPQGCIKEAQAHMARLYGAAATFFLVNGASVGLMAALLAMNAPGKAVWIAEDAHISLYHALVLTGGRPMPAPVKVDPVWGISLGVDMDAWKHLLAHETDGDLAVSTHPSYHGVGAPLAALAASLEARPEVAWLVDESHGAHLPFIAGALPSAMDFPADAVVHSTHKMLGSLTQAALLHSLNPAWTGRLAETLCILHSTSPSYLLMASLDAVAGYMAADGRRKLLDLESLAGELAQGIRDIGGYRLFQDEVGGGYSMDVCKITLSGAELGLSGFDLAGILRRQFKIDVEMSTDFYVLCLLTMGHEIGDIRRILSALKHIAGTCATGGTLRARTGRDKGGPACGKGYGRLGPVILERTPRDVYFEPKEIVSLSQARGRLAAHIVAAYPPGTPLVYPGQRLSQQDADRIMAVKEAGGALTGLLEGDRVQVCREV